jgi:hypothetical protein
LILDDCDGHAGNLKEVAKDIDLLLKTFQSFVILARSIGTVLPRNRLREGSACDGKQRRSKETRRQGCGGFDHLVLPPHFLKYNVIPCSNSE